MAGKSAVWTCMAMRTMGISVENREKDSFMTGSNKEKRVMAGIS